MASKSSAAIASASISQSASASGFGSHLSTKAVVEEKVDFEYGLAIVGDSSVGKTSLMYQELETHPKNFQFKGAGIRFENKLYYSLGFNNLVQFWDCPGQLIYLKHTARYCAGCAGIVLVYDVTNAESFQHLDEIISEVRKNGSQILIAVVANKCDKPGRVITREQGESFANSLQAVVYQETSALKGEGIREVFTPLVMAIAKSIPSPIDALSLLRRNIKFSDRLITDKKIATLSRAAFQQSEFESADVTTTADWIKAP